MGSERGRAGDSTRVKTQVSSSMRHSKENSMTMQSTRSVLPDPSPRNRTRSPHPPSCPAHTQVCARAQVPLTFLHVRASRPRRETRAPTRRTQHGRRALRAPLALPRTRIGLRAQPSARTRRRPACVWRLSCARSSTGATPFTLSASARGLPRPRGPPGRQQSTRRYARALGRTGAWAHGRAGA